MGEGVRPGLPDTYASWWKADHTYRSKGGGALLLQGNLHLRAEQLLKTLNRKPCGLLVFLEPAVIYLLPYQDRQRAALVGW